MLLITLILAPLTFATPVPAGSTPARIAFLRAKGAGAGDVVLIDPSGAVANERPPALRGITLLPVEFNGRTELERLFPDRPRRHADVPGASRIELPNGAGSLYRFVRDDAGVTRFGYFLVDADGDARSLLERDGIGPLGDQDPFVERIAVAPDGTLLVATRTAAGGDLLEVALDGTQVERTSALGPRRFLPGGLTLLAGWGIASTPAGIVRFTRTPGAQAEAVPFAPLPPYFSGDVVRSRDGSHAATIAGDDAATAHVYVFTAAGPAVRASQTPMSLSGAGFLPDALDGPHLAVSDDGTTCAWRVEAGAAREAFVSRMGAVQHTQAWITADPNYVDTLDEIGQFLFLPLSATLVVAVGKVGDVPSSIQDLDYYSVALDDAGTPSFVNLTGTSGDLDAPFSGGSTIEPVGTAVVPGADRVILFDGQGNNGPLYALGPTGSTQILGSVRDLEFAELVGGNLVLGVNRLVGGSDRFEVHVLAAGANATQLVGSPGTGDFLTNATTGPNGEVAFVQRAPAGEHVWRVDPVAATLRTLTPRSLVYGPSIGYAASGVLGLGIGAVGNPTVEVGWGPGQQVMRLSVGGSTVLLPGA